MKPALPPRLGRTRILAAALTLLLVASLALPGGSVTAAPRGDVREKLARAADSPPQDTIADDFDPNTRFAGNDGSRPWTNAWQELGEADGPGAGRVEIETSSFCAAGACLKIGGSLKSLAGMGVSREADLTGAISATLSFVYMSDSFGSSASVKAEVSSNGGANWTTLGVYTLTNISTAPITPTFNITPYISPHTQVRFIGVGSTGMQANFHADNIVIRYQLPDSQPAIGDRVWADADRDGVQDAGEPGLANVRVRLYEGLCAHRAGQTSRTTTTAANGSYSFPITAAGDYCVTVDEATAPAGHVATTLLPREVTLATLQSFDDADFGFAPAAADDRLAVGAYAPCPDAAWLQQIAQAYSATLSSQNQATCG